MRAFAIAIAAAIPTLAAVGSCANGMQAQAASISASDNDCAVIAAVAKEHYKFGLDNPAPPLKGLGEPGWRPQCDWSKQGLAFTDYNNVPATAEPRDRLKWVEFKQPRYDAQGAVIETSIMHGPLAGTGYECRVRSGIAGWTVTECKIAWVS
jgi:hypothetical protein